MANLGRRHRAEVFHFGVPACVPDAVGDDASRWPWPATRGTTGRRAARKANRSAILGLSHVRRMRDK
jgi:hypothetical protein